MKAWVIAPSAAEANTSERYLPDIEKYQVAITGRPIVPDNPDDDRKQLGRRFASIQVGDLIILANGMNKSKTCYFAGFAGDVGSMALAQIIGAAQVRHITNFVSLKGKKIPFNSNCKHGGILRVILSMGVMLLMLKTIQQTKQLRIRFCR